MERTKMKYKRKKHGKIARNGVNMMVILKFPEKIATGCCGHCSWMFEFLACCLNNFSLPGCCGDLRKTEVCTWYVNFTNGQGEPNRFSATCCVG